VTDSKTVNHKNIEPIDGFNDNAVTEVTVSTPAENSQTLHRASFMGRVAGIIVLAICLNAAAAPVPPELAYFIGNWTITLKDGQKGYTWSVKEDLRGEWITGIVEKDGERTSTDHWRINSRGIERHVFNSDGTYIKLNGSTWKIGKMSFTGVAYGKQGEYRMRETIFRESDTRFRALWEKQGTDGTWTTVSDESCSK
jgi:hypothetical protein